MKNTVRILTVLVLALLLCVGLIACAHKEASDHTPTGEWLTDETHHWHACEKEKCEDAGDKAEHTYANACDADCNVCGYARTAGAHVYDNACDTACNVCGATREITHAHGTTLTAGDTTHWYACSVCGDKKDEAAHVFDKTVASSEYLKAAATATTKAQYWKSCACGAKSDTEYFETDKTAGTLANIQDLSKTYDKVALANPTYETNSDGAVTIEWYQGTTKLDAKPVNAGTYKVKVIIAESATYAGISAEKEFTIAKKVLSGLSVDLTYAGTKSFEVPLGAANGILAGDVADGIRVCITFANKNVGAAVTGAGLDAEDGNNFTNYELDLTTCTASIVPKVLTNIFLGNTTYKGSTNFSYALSAYHGLVSGESFTLQVTTVSKNVGNDVEIASISYNNSNYSIDKSAITLDIVPKALNRLDIEVTYDGGNIISSFDLTAADGVIAGDDVWLYGDGNQSYDVAYDEYTLFALDWEGDNALTKEYVEIKGADAANYKFAYATDESVGTITVMPYILDFTGEYVKDADGTHYFTFTQDVTWSHGGTDTVTVKIELLDPEGNWITAPGVYTQENAQIGGESFYIGGVKREEFELDEDYYADEFEVTVLSSDDLILQVTDRFNIGPDYIISVQVKQGTVKRGDSIVLPGTPDKVYKVLAIEKFYDFLDYATVGDEVGLYVDGMAALTEVAPLSFLYEDGNIPEMASEFLAKLYLKTETEGGRHSPVTGVTYMPMLRGLGPVQQVTITRISHYAKEDTLIWTPGETVLAKITLATPVPAALLHGLEFTMAEDTKVTVTGVVVDDIIESAPSGNSMLMTDEFNTEALTPVVVKITNTRTEALDTLGLFVSNGSGGGSYLTDYTIELYDEDFVRILGTHNNTEGTFTKDDSSTWSLAAGETCYVVVKTTDATNGVFVRLM